MDESVATKGVYILEIFLNQHPNLLPAWELHLEEPEHKLALEPCCAGLMANSIPFQRIGAFVCIEDAH